MPDPFRIFPHATAAQRAELRASITAVGLRNPVVVDDQGDVIDGHERRDICLELHLDWLAGADVRIGLTEIQKKALAIELNLWRRPIHLTRQQRNELLDVYLIANPHLSEPQIAQLFGVNQATVNRRKRSLMQSHKLPKVLSTVGKDGVTRRVGERQRRPARMVVKSSGEFEKLKSDLLEVADDLHGLVRRPSRLQSLARRKRRQEEVDRTTSIALPSSIRLEHCDFRDLKVEPGTVDVVLTDVVWSMKAQPDWRELARLAQTWLRDNGLFCSLIGNYSQPYLCNALMQHLLYQFTINIDYPTPTRSYLRNIIENWRPAPIFAKSDKLVINRLSDKLSVPTRHAQGHAKDYHDWQQSLWVALELMKRLTKPGDVILDPHLGTGTNAVACSLLGYRTFIGCDIDAEQVKRARYRVATEGEQKSA